MKLGDLNRDSPPADVAQAIIGEAKRRGYTRDETIAVLADAIQESGLRPTAVSPNGAWHGVFQQDGSYPGRDDPNENIRAFFDRLDIKRNSPGASPDIWKNIFWLQQRPSDPTAEQAYTQGRRGYLAEIQHRANEAAAYYQRYTGGVAVPQTTVADHPDYNEFPIWSANNSDRDGTKIDAFFLHTQEGGGGDDAAENLANWFKNSNGVSYHYTVSQASDGGVTVVDCVDTDRMSWSVLSANARSINLCYAGSRAAWTEQQWMDRAKAIDVSAYIAVADCRKYGIPIHVIRPPYTARIPGISDHRYVTKVLGDGSHTDVGDNFPWLYFVDRVTHWTTNGDKPPEQPTSKRFPQDWTDRDLLIEILRQERGAMLEGWPQMGGRTQVDYLVHLGQKIDALAALVEKTE